MVVSRTVKGTFTYPIVTLVQCEGSHLCVERDDCMHYVVNYYTIAAATIVRLKSDGYIVSRL